MKFSLLASALALAQIAAAFPAPEKVSIDIDPKKLEAQFVKVRAEHKAATQGDVSVMGDIIKPGDGIPGAITTRNELIEGGCKPIIVIFARGTTEPGNVGDDVGPSFFDNLELLEPGRVLIQGVNNYPADIWGYLGGGSESGADDMAASVARAISQCPSSKIVLSGFSQGAQVTHKAAARMPTAHRSYVGAIVLFGDPNNGTPFPGVLNNNVLTFCNDGDLICDGWPIPTSDHSNYENDGPAAAKYVADRL
ncbi:cutinase-domain-containing protein [Ascodesmis nigricans]|uniref:cutinase n=1 Tax=Ascodesmis nigricans TaxID=341454 RepID=A0A4S2MW48_9PEZI|nr:cutinase-domain-containing protein [Ascodesmis nigricans]